MASQTERTASLEQSRKIFAAILTVLVPSLLLWGWYVTTNVVAIKQQLLDGGNKQIVAELRSPGSPAKLRASLATVIAQVQTARADSAQPNTQKLAKLAEAVGVVTEEHPTVPEGWQAASQLIDYRSGSASAEPNKQSCLSAPFDVAPFPPLRTPGFEYVQMFRNCEITLDDLGGFLASEPYRQMSKVQASRSENTFVPPKLKLINVHVVYHGGPLLPISAVEFVGCTFDFNVQSLPTPKGQYLTRQLLSAKDMADVEVRG